MGVLVNRREFIRRFFAVVGAATCCGTLAAAFGCSGTQAGIEGTVRAYVQAKFNGDVDTMYSLMPRGYLSHMVGSNGQRSEEWFKEALLPVWCENFQDDVRSYVGNNASLTSIEVHEINTPDEDELARIDRELRSCYDYEEGELQDAAGAVVWWSAKGDSGTVGGEDGGTAGYIVWVELNLVKCSGEWYVQPGILVDFNLT